MYTVVNNSKANIHVNTAYYRRDCILPQIRGVESLNPSVFGVRACKEVIKVKRAHERGP